jgi:hypothetical protein
MNHSQVQQTKNNDKPKQLVQQQEITGKIKPNAL